MIHPQYKEFRYLATSTNNTSGFHHWRASDVNGTKEAQLLGSVVAVLQRSPLGFNMAIGSTLHIP